MTQLAPRPRIRLLAALAALTFIPLACTDDVSGQEMGTGSETDTDTAPGACGLFVGDLVISELVANVDGADAGLEWFEIYNASDETKNLEGLTLVYADSDMSGRKEHVVNRSLEVPAGGYVVVSGILDELAEGLEHVDYGYAGDLGEFTNGGGYLALECDNLIDEIYYEEVSDTASRTFDGTIAPDATANNALDSWCDSRTPFTEDFAATPRAPNDACGGGTSCMQNGELVEVINPQLGELVITELFQNPTFAEDDDAEWFELYNAGESTIHLNGVDIGKDPEDEAIETIAAVECIVLEAGAFALIAQSEDPELNGQLPQPDYVMASVQLSNSANSLWVGINDELLDLVTYPDAEEDASYTLDPGSYDVAANDGELNWCEAQELTFNNGLAFGTPKADNEVCPLPPPEDGQCYEGDVLRDVVPFAPGDLEIVELLPNPDCVEDAAGEWFELLAKADGDLNGLNYGKAGAWSGQVEGLEPGACISVSAGDHVLVARESDPGVNGELPPVDALFDMALNNSNSDLIIGYGDDPSMPDDQATWTSTSAGATLSKDSNGDWCDGVDPYGCGTLGTPGEPNPICGQGGDGDGDPDTCIDPDTDNERMIIKPEMGQLTLSEVMPNPSTPEPNGEWFELHASAQLDLNGLELGKNGVPAHTVNSEMCIEVTADSYVVLARSDLNECMLPQVDYVYANLNLSNGGGNNVEIGYEGIVWDSYTWDNATSNGVALSYDPMNMSWCDAVDAFGCGDLATPGAANPACGMGGGGEGMCFDGNAMRAIVTPDPGQLVISEFMANPSAVADADGEWFELHALATFDLNELDIGRAFVDGPLHTITANDCIVVNDGDHALLARNGDPLANGGMASVDYVYSALGLNNSNSALHVAAGDVLLDEVSWASTSAGASTSLDPSITDPNLNDVGNNADPNWCYATAVYGDGDEGTPGDVNFACN